MIYLDYGATSFKKPPTVAEAVRRAMFTCANPGRGGYLPSEEAAKTVFRCRERCAGFFDCDPEQVVFTANCTHGLNIAIQTLVEPGDRVIVSGFEHNAVMRPLHALEADVVVAGRRLFDWENTLKEFRSALEKGAKAAVFTHVSNVFGYVHPVAELAELCHHYGVPFILDAAQSAGSLPVKLRELGAAFIAAPGHKGLLGPQGTGVLLCNRLPRPLLLGGTGSNSLSRQMPDFLPDIGEAGTLNVPGIAGLDAGLSYLQRVGIPNIALREQREAEACARGLEALGVLVFRGEHGSNVISFVPEGDCEVVAEAFAHQGVCLRAGLHCAPLAHESGGTLATGTVRVSFGYDASAGQTRSFLKTAEKILRFS